LCGALVLNVSRLVVMLTLPAFIVAIALLIAVHEYGHYRMALACGVKVLRFSIGFGKPLWHRQATPTSTEFVLALFPLGGYVKMLDEREGPVELAQRHLAFNTQSLSRRAAIVAAGPLANLLLAVVLYSAVNWIGVELPEAVLSQPAAGSLASQAGLKAGERVKRIGRQDDDLTAVSSFEDVRWTLTQAALEGTDVRLLVAGTNQSEREVLLPVATLEIGQVDATLFAKIGISSPFSQALIGDVQPDGAAAAAGLQPGDVVLQVNDTEIVDGQQLRRLIRGSITGQAHIWKVSRQGRVFAINVTPKVVPDAGETVGRIGAYVGAKPALVLVRYGVFEGVWRGLVQTWDVSILTLKMMGKMVIGQVSIKNISGPLTIADFAGKSADLGLTAYLVFLALISVSLGVLNLLPLPVLDGGHLMYYLWEGIIGKPVADRWMERLQHGGVALLVLLMSIALLNDVTRLLN
jgi:regulator of sigma E protease